MSFLILGMKIGLWLLIFTVILGAGYFYFIKLQRVCLNEDLHPHADD